MKPCPAPHHTRCRGENCGRPIRWAVTEAGKPIPIDPDPVDDGPLVMTSLEVGAETVKVRGLKRGETPPPEAPRYMPHHATCVDRDSFARRRK